MQWYETTQEEFDRNCPVIDDYNLEECDYDEEDESVRIPLVEYDNLLRIEKEYHRLLKEMYREY